MEKSTITIKEVADYAKVSQATVSRAINGLSSVKEANRKKVFEAIEALGYIPNSAAQALASSRSNVIGMLVGSLDGPFYGSLMQAAEDVVYGNKKHLLVTSGRDSEKKESESIEFLLSNRVDGLIIHADKLSDQKLIELSQRVPALIVLNRYIPEISTQCIYFDNEQGGYIATKHLIDNGHKDIACITGPLEKTDSQERLQGYRRALLEAGIELNPNLIISGRFDHPDNVKVVERLFARQEKITAVFCQNDNIALAVYNVCAEKGIQIGEDLSVIGFDNQMYSDYIHPRLASIYFPIQEMGQVAGETVLKILDGSSTGIDNKLQPELIVRESVCKLSD